MTREAKKISKSSKSLEAFWSNQFSQDNEFEKFKELAAKGELAEKDQEDDEEEEEEDPADEESDGDGDDYVVVSLATGHGIFILIDLWLLTLIKSKQYCWWNVAAILLQYFAVRLNCFFEAGNDWIICFFTRRE